MSNSRRSVILIVLVFITFANVESYRERERQSQDAFWRDRLLRRHYRQVLQQRQGQGPGQGPPPQQQPPRMPQQGRQNGPLSKSELRNQFPDTFGGPVDNSPIGTLLREFKQAKKALGELIYTFKQYLRETDSSKIFKDTKAFEEEQLLAPLFDRLANALVQSPPDWQSTVASIPSPIPLKIKDLLTEASQNYDRIKKLCKHYRRIIDPSTKAKGSQFQASKVLSPLRKEMEDVEELVKLNEGLREEIQNAEKEGAGADSSEVESPAALASASASDYNSYSEGGAVEETDAEADSKGEDYGDGDDIDNGEGDGDGEDEPKPKVSGAVSCRMSSSGLGVSVIGATLLIYYHYEVI